MSGLLFPKPARATKERKPLRRNTPLKRSTKPIARRKQLRRSKRLPRASGREPAAFDLPTIYRVFGPMPTCVLTCKHEVELHHICGRGELFGFAKDHPYRRLLSSPFNCAPLDHAVHAGPHRDAPEMRCLLLRLASQAVYEAVGQGAYELTANDRGFLLLADQWRREHGDATLRPSEPPDEQ
jgi:hypothetical protein